MTKTVLVTGATGFIGSNLCNRLYEDHTVIAVGTSCENKPKCHQFLQLNLDGIPWDLMPNIDICFHQAANNDTTDMDRSRMLHANFVAPSEFFTILFNYKNCKQFVYASSSSIYGNQPVPYVEGKTLLDPLNPYAESKKMFEEYAEAFALEFGVNVIGLRYTNVYGPGEGHKGKRASMIHQLLQKMLRGESPKIFKNGEQLRDWVYIDDVVKANLLCSTYSGSAVFNVGAGDALSFNDIVKTLNSELYTNLVPEYVDCPFPDKYQSHTLADLDKIRKAIGYVPEYSVRNGIKKFVAETKKAG